MADIPNSVTTAAQGNQLYDASWTTDAGVILINIADADGNGSNGAQAQQVVAVDIGS